MTNPFDMTGRTALVTGSTAGMGLEIARGLHAVGARTIISSNDVDDVATAQKALAAEGIEVEGIVCDLRDAESARSLGERARSRFGRIDALVAHAGGHTPTGTLIETSEDDVALAFQSTVFHNLLIIQGFLPDMAEDGGGSVVLTTSIASVRANQMLGVYGATKAALGSIVRNVAAEWGEKGIRANAVAPATVRTKFSEVLWSDTSREHAAAGRTALGRIAEAHEVVGAVLLFASSAGSYITGQTLLVDGGRSII